MLLIFQTNYWIISPSTLRYPLFPFISVNIFLQDIKGARSVLKQFLTIENHLKMMEKNASYFTSKAIFVIKIFKFLSWILVMQQNGLNRKIRLISGFMTSQLDCQTIAIHIFPNISRSKDNQTMTFSQLIENNMRNIFLEKSYSNCRGETSPRPFSVKLKLRISLER